MRIIDFMGTGTDAQIIGNTLEGPVLLLCCEMSKLSGYSFPCFPLMVTIFISEVNVRN